MTEAEFVAKEQKKCDTRLKNQLRKILKTGFAGRETIELLLVNSLIEFTRPSATIPYNHYKLTQHGFETLKKLS